MKLTDKVSFCGLYYISLDINSACNQFCVASALTEKSMKILLVENIFVYQFQEFTKQL